MGYKGARFMQERYDISDSEVMLHQSGRKVQVIKPQV